MAEKNIVDIDREAANYGPLITDDVYLERSATLLKKWGMNRPTRTVSVDGGEGYDEFRFTPVGLSPVGDRPDAHQKNSFVISTTNQTGELIIKHLGGNTEYKLKNIDLITFDDKSYDFNELVEEAKNHTPALDVVTKEALKRSSGNGKQ